jgi:hypothetical protein
MIKKKITEEMNMHVEWEKQAENMTLKMLPKFISMLMNDYEHDYETKVNAVVCGMMATMKAMTVNHYRGHLSGYQQCCIMWDLIEKIEFRDNKVGLRLINYDNLLYPGREESFKMKISIGMHKRLKKRAAELLKDALAINNSPPVHQVIKDHWIDIISGKIPYGITVDKTMISRGE